MFVRSYDSWAASVIHIWARAFQCSSEAFYNGTAGRVLRGKPLKVSGMMPFADLINHQSYTDGLYSDEYKAGQSVVSQIRGAVGLLPSSKLGGYPVHISVSQVRACL